MRPSRKASSSSFNLRRDGFTLVELLVAMAVVAIVILIITNLVNGVSLTTDRSHRRIEADAGARLVLDRLGLDLERMLKRPDVNYAFSKNTDNDSLSFFAATAGYGVAERTLSIVSYRVNGDYQLERGVATVTTGSNWKTPIFVAASNQAINHPSVPQAALAPSDYQVLGEDVLRFEFTFLIKDGAGVRTDSAAPAKFEDLRGVIVGIALLDARSRSILSAAQLQRLSRTLSDPSGAGTNGEPMDILSQWLPGAGKPLNDLPATATSNLRVYQRYYFFP